MRHVPTPKNDSDITFEKRGKFGKYLITFVFTKQYKKKCYRFSTKHVHGQISFSAEKSIFDRTLFSEYKV